MSDVYMFDYVTVASEAGLSREQLETIKQVVRQDYPTDDMLWELHVLRACNAIRDRRTTFEEAFGEDHRQRTHAVQGEQSQPTHYVG
jgi:hypothetical protein